MIFLVKKYIVVIFPCLCALVVLYRLHGRQYYSKYVNQGLGLEERSSGKEIIKQFQRLKFENVKLRERQEQHNPHTSNTNKDIPKAYKNFYDKSLKDGVPIPLLEEIVKANLTQEQILNHFKSNWFLHPSTTKQGKYEKEQYFSQDKQDAFVDNYFKQKRNGVFLEVGAADGLVYSNTLFFERSRSWTGLLIEPNKEFFETLAKLHRNAYALNVCLSIENKTSIVKFHPAGLIGGIENIMKGPLMERAKKEAPYIKRTESICIPVYSIVKALNMSYINFFSLDVEGAELKILKTIPSDKVKIDLFYIEYAITNADGIDGLATNKKLNEVNEFFGRLKIYKQVHRTFQDVVFALK